MGWTWKGPEKFIGSLKFAVIAISLFTVAMVVGTFLESFYGTEFANRLLYKSPLFMFLQFLLFFSIAMAALLRLPPKKRLYGFYTIHSGLILIGVGSFITFYAGIDSSLTLLPHTPTRQITVDQDIFTITYPTKGETFIYKLPYSALEKRLGDRHGPVELLRYLPFSESRLHWVPDQFAKAPKAPKTPKTPKAPSTHYLLSNDRVSQEFTLTLHPRALDFKSSLPMGPLQVHYLPPSLGPCFAKNPPSKLIFWDRTGRCFTPEDRSRSRSQVNMGQTSTGKRFVVLRMDGGDGEEEALTFFPEISPWPLGGEKGEKRHLPRRDSPVRVLSTRLFEGRPHLFLFGTTASFYQDGQWKTHRLTKDKGVPLPWMGFELRALRHTDGREVPTFIPQYQTPRQVDGQLVRGGQKAVEVRVNDGQSYWVTDQRPLSLFVEGQEILFHIKKRELQLPFEFILTKFKMDKDPGTENPSSFESFVRLFTKTGPQDHHIYMNNPLKYGGMTFYQSSYFQTESGEYGSVLSANIDPGRWAKYLGSLMLVLGALAHYQLQVHMRRKRVKLE